VLSGTTQIGLVDRADWLLTMIPAFLDTPLPQAEWSRVIGEQTPHADAAGTPARRV